MGTSEQLIEYRHNILGQRVAKLVNGQIVEHYLWQNLTTLLATYDGSGNLKQRFEYAAGHTPTSFTQSGQRYYIQTDHLGSPRVITDTSGSIVRAIRYDSYGNIVEDTNPSFEIPFGFAGGLYDADTGLIRFGYRDYDPYTGRGATRDPIGFDGGDPNLYGYVLSDPIRFIDPIGLDVSINYHRRGTVDYEYTKEIAPPDGSISTSAHGYPGSLVDERRNSEITIERLVGDIVASESYEKGKPIYLYSCDAATGEDSVAEKLSEALPDNPVYGYPGLISVDSEGNVTPAVTEWSAH